jgi:hypothetical protein
MPAFIPARGRTPHLAGVCVNRIGTVRSSCFLILNVAKLGRLATHTFQNSSIKVAATGAEELSPTRYPRHILDGQS